MAQSGLSNLVFYLLDDDASVGEQPVFGYASEYPEIVVDETTPRFRSRMLSEDNLGLKAGFCLTACRKRSFLNEATLATPSDEDLAAQRELALLRDWSRASDRPIIAYQLEFMGNEHGVQGRIDDRAELWESMEPEQRRKTLSQSAAMVVDWFGQNRPLSPGVEEEAILAELLSATRENLPFYVHVFEQLVNYNRVIDSMVEAQHIRLSDHACKMFIRFPSYMLRRCLSRETREDYNRRGHYLDCLASAFRYHLAPLPVEQFCDYLSAKADCMPQARVDLAWFIGELSQSARAQQPLPLSA
ncbi:MAG: hypothetical protein RJA70_1555 [Pseudomonadota bacterium]|jgi:hypothetical protein